MIAFLLASIVAAAPAAPPWSAADLTVAACSRLSDAEEAVDATLVAKAIDLVLAADVQTLSDRQDALEAVLVRHRDLHRAERCADAVWVNSGDPNDALYLQADMVGSVTKATASALRIEVLRSYVVDAAAILAALAIDRGDRQQAGRWLATGARIAPNDPVLVRLRRLLTSPAAPEGAVGTLRAALRSSRAS